MILRRITEHVQAQNWTAVALDFFIVVVGVFIGIQVSNWNTSSTERSLEQEYLTLLSRDIAVIETKLNAQIDHEEGVSNAAADALARINNWTDTADALRLGETLALTFGRRTLSLDSPTFSELKSAGRITVIRDISLRNQLIAYFEGLSRAERVVGKNNDFLVESYTAYMRDIGLGYVPVSSEVCSDGQNAIQCQLSEAMIETMNGELTHAAGTVLQAPPGDFFWDQLRSQIAYRNIATIGNLIRANEALDETREMSLAIENAQ